MFLYKNSIKIFVDLNLLLSCDLYNVIELGINKVLK